MAVEGSALLPRERAPRSWLPVSLAVGGVVYFCVVLSATTASSRSSLLSRQEQLAGYTMSGAIDVPTHPPGMPYVKMDPMGKMAITNPDGDQLGSVNFQTAPDPIPPPPTIIRFGSVGVAPAGCPMCPVLDLEAVAAQKEKLKENQARVARLEVEDNRNMARVDNTIKSFKWLKDVMAEKLFTMKEALKASDCEPPALRTFPRSCATTFRPENALSVALAPPRVLPASNPCAHALAAQLEFQMIAKENTTGAEGPGGARGWAGANGINGEKGVDGAQGPMGREGAEGPIGKEGDKGPLGITGSVGSQGVVVSAPPLHLPYLSREMPCGGMLLGVRWACVQ